MDQQAYALHLDGAGIHCPVGGRHLFAHRESTAQGDRLTMTHIFLGGNP